MKIIPTLAILLLLVSFVSAQCLDSDDGKNKYESGTVKDRDQSYTDACQAADIKEYFCSVDDTAAYTILPCVNGCKEGACQLANQVPKAQAPSLSTTSNTNLYLYGAVAFILIGLYIYLFKIRPRKKKRY
ncbi:hypothetical protein HZA98_00140 [Candidatus Woesearchaeota archaeon]|nr:hypothetical protein [Candidatus Woesearchaeota archaeon]